MSKFERETKKYEKQLASNPATVESLMDILAEVNISEGNFRECSFAEIAAEVKINHVTRFLARFCS